MLLTTSIQYNKPVLSFLPVQAVFNKAYEVCNYYNFVDGFGFRNVQVKFLFNPILTGLFFSDGGEGGGGGSFEGTITSVRHFLLVYVPIDLGVSKSFLGTDFYAQTNKHLDNFIQRIKSIVRNKFYRLDSDLPT